MKARHGKQYRKVPKGTFLGIWVLLAFGLAEHEQGHTSGSIYPTFHLPISQPPRGEMNKTISRAQ